MDFHTTSNWESHNAKKIIEASYGDYFDISSIAKSNPSKSLKCDLKFTLQNITFLIKIEFNLLLRKKNEG